MIITGILMRMWITGRIFLPIIIGIAIFKQSFTQENGCLKFEYEQGVYTPLSKSASTLVFHADSGENLFQRIQSLPKSFEWCDTSFQNLHISLHGGIQFYDFNPSKPVLYLAKVFDAKVKKSTMQSNASTIYRVHILNDFLDREIFEFANFGSLYDSTDLISYQLHIDYNSRSIELVFGEFVVNDWDSLNRFFNLYPCTGKPVVSVYHADTVTSDFGSLLSSQMSSVKGNNDQYTLDTENYFVTKDTVSFIDAPIPSGTVFRFKNGWSNTSIGQVKSNSKEIEIYPNPSQGIIHVQSESEVLRLQVKTLDGKLIRTISANSTNQYNLELERGLYLLEVTLKNQDYLCIKKHIVY